MLVMASRGVVWMTFLHSRENLLKGKGMWLRILIRNPLEMEIGIWWNWKWWEVGPGGELKMAY
jgi:hypothetical protein